MQSGILNQTFSKQNQAKLEIKLEFDKVDLSLSQIQDILNLTKTAAQAYNDFQIIHAGQ